jgi:hypothetical protein
MKATGAVSITTLYLVAFYTLLHFDVSPLLTGLVYLSIPLVIICMVLLVLLDDSVKYPELENEEWGYADKKKEDLWII